MTPSSADPSIFQNSALEVLQHLGVKTIRYNVPASKLSAWEVGAPVPVVYEPVNSCELCVVVSALNDRAIPWQVIGAGTNLLFPDEPIQCVLVRMSRSLGWITRFGEEISVGAGAYVPRLAQRTATWGLAGLEHVVGIPGTFGGLITMNGGSQRRSISELVKQVSIVDSRGVARTLTTEQCGFAYRTSRFQNERSIIVSAVLKAKRGDSVAIRAEMRNILATRRAKFPISEPNCGSVFVSDPEMYSTIGPPGEVIERLNLKGHSVGGAQVSFQHANFIITTRDARAADVVQLIAYVREKVYYATGYRLTCEVRYIDTSGRVTRLCDGATGKL